MVGVLTGSGGRLVSGNKMSWVWSGVVKRRRGQRDVWRIAGDRVLGICAVHTWREVDWGGGGGGLDRRGGGSGERRGVCEGGVAIHGHRGRHHLGVGQGGRAVSVYGGRGGGVRHVHWDSLALSCLLGGLVEAVSGVVGVEVGEAI